MALETFGYIDDLDPSSPDGATEYVSQGDDHIRGIKLTLQNTFPNLNGAVTATPAELNVLSDAAAAREAFGFFYTMTGGVQTLAYTFSGQYISPNIAQVLTAADGHGFIVPYTGHIILSRSHVRANSLNALAYFRLVVNGVVGGIIGTYAPGGIGPGGGVPLTVAVTAGARVTIQFDTAATDGAISDYNLTLVLTS